MPSFLRTINAEAFLGPLPPPRNQPGLQQAAPARQAPPPAVPLGPEQGEAHQPGGGGSPPPAPPTEALDVREVDDDDALSKRVGRLLNMQADWTWQQLARESGA